MWSMGLEHMEEFPQSRKQHSHIIWSRCRLIMNFIKVDNGFTIFILMATFILHCVWQVEVYRQELCGYQWNSIFNLQSTGLSCKFEFHLPSLRDIPSNDLLLWRLCRHRRDKQIKDLNRSNPTWSAHNDYLPLDSWCPCLFNWNHHQHPGTVQTVQTVQTVFPQCWDWDKFPNENNDRHDGEEVLNSAE